MDAYSVADRLQDAYGFWAWMRDHHLGHASALVELVCFVNLDIMVLFGACTGALSAEIVQILRMKKPAE